MCVCRYEKIPRVDIIQNIFGFIFLFTAPPAIHTVINSFENAATAVADPLLSFFHFISAFLPFCSLLCIKLDYFFSTRKGTIVRRIKSPRAATFLERGAIDGVVAGGEVGEGA